METFSCYVCAESVPLAFGHVHHKRPQAAGGGPDDEVQLCNSCHMNLHQVAHCLMNAKRAGSAADLVRAQYRNPAVVRRMLELSQLVAEWMLLKRDGKVRPNDEVELAIALPMEIRQAMTLMSADRYGKPSVARFARDVICETVLARYPQLRKKPS